MGLAASQARLLTITARKADCEFLSMNLSHQKLALSRNMEMISGEYQKALNQTKLVFDYYGASDKSMPLTYGLLMKPSVYNDYYPKLLTDSKNRVILDGALASAVRFAGIPAEGFKGTASSDVRNKFIEGLAQAGIINKTQASTIQGTTFNNTLGLGNEISASQSITELSFDQLMDLMDTTGKKSDEAGVLLGTSQKDKKGGKPQRLIAIKPNGEFETHMDQPDSASISISDLLNPDMNYVIAYESKEGKKDGHTPVDTMMILQQDMVNGSDGKSVLDWIKEEFVAVLGGSPANDTALQYAYNAVYDLLYPSDNLQNATDYSSGPLFEVGTQVLDTKNDEGFNPIVANKSNSNLGFCFSLNHKKKPFHVQRNDNATVAINISNVTEAFLTSYVQYMQGIEESEYGWQKGSMTDCNMYDPKKDDFKFSIVTDTVVDDKDSKLITNFYDTMFNNICVNGWTENPQIADEEYMTQMLKNGMVFISSISDDGYYYQGNYKTDRNIVEVSDDDAISKAQSKYNTEKTKIENKEETIDMKMKSLDTEISALTTEYDTTKQVITKSIEKSFKRYEA